MNSSLIIFFDGRCPLCVAEMTKLSRYDVDHRLAFEDISQDDFSQRFPQIDMQQADRMLHALDGYGEVLRGMEVNREAWRLVGLGWFHAWTGWPLIKPVSDSCYLFFAKHRYVFSYWMTGSSRCESGSCTVEQQHREQLAQAEQEQKTHTKKAA